MRKFLLSTIAVFMSIAMMAIGKGDGTSKANAIDFDWADGHKPALSAGSWYRVSLSPLSEEAYDPTLALYLTNLTDETASVKLTMQAELLGQSVNQNSSYNIAGKDFQLWSRQSFDYNGRVMSLKQLMSAGLKEVYLQLTSNKEIALSAKVYETEDIVDDACTKAKDFHWSGVDVPKGEQWFRLNLSDVKSTDNKLKFVVTNNGGAEAKVSFDMSLDCPASAVIEKDWVIAPGADMEDEFGRVFLDVLKEDYVFLKLTNDQPLTLRVEEEIVVIPPGKYDDFDCASAPELAFDTELDLTAGQHIYKVKRDALLGGRSLASEFYVTNNGATPANLTVETAFACPVKSTVDQSLVIEGNTTIVKAIKDNVLKSVDVEWVYLRFITDQDLTATVGKRNIDPCANAVPFDWTVGASLAAGESQWYEVDITSLKRDKKHLTLAFTNHSDNVALVNVEVALDCNGTIMPITLPIYGGLSIGHTIDYNLLKHSPLNRIYVGLSTDSHIEMAASVKDAIAADPTPCQNALNPEHGVEYTHEANTTHWYKISLDLLESTADYSSLYLSNKGNQRAHVTFGVVTDCQYTPSNRITLPMPTKFDLGLLGPNVLGKLLKELARIERLYSKVDSKDIYLEIHSDQPIGFGLDVINAATSPCLRSDLITFDWNKGAKVEKGDGMKWFDMDLDAVKAAGKHVKLTFTNHSDSLVWAATMVSVECPAKLTMPLLVPVPAGMSVDHVINYQLFAVADLHNIYIGVVTDGELELKAESIDATILPPANCLNAQVIVSGKEYVQNAGTQWYQFPMSLIDEMGSAAKISFKNLTSNHATLSAGVTVGCEYPVNTIAKAKAPRDIQFSLNVPKFIISKVRGLIDPALTDFYIQLTTDQKIAFTLNNQATDVRACSNAIDFDWKTWEQDGLQLEANKANWYKVNFEYVFEKLEKGEDISVGLTNPSKNMDVAVDLAVSPTCPVVLSLEKSVNIPAGTSAGVKVSYDQLMSLIDKYDKYDLYGRDYEGMLKKINAYVLYNKLDQMLTERGYDEYIPLYRIEPLVDRYGEAASLVNLKALLDNPRKYISVAEIKERLEPVKVKIQNEVEERMSFDYMIGLLETYGDKIPKVDAEQIINNADLLLPYIGSANIILDKCKQYISKEDLKQHLVDIVNRIPFDEVKEFFQRVENKLKQYMPEPNTFYIYVKTTGELVINPEIPVAPECEGIVDTIVAVACDTFVWKGIPYTESGIYRDSTSASEPADAACLDWKQTVKLSEFSEPWYKLDISEIKTNKLDFKLSLENDLNTTLNYTIELYDCYLEPMLSGSSDVEGGLLNRTVTYAEFMKYTDGLDCDYLYLRNVNYDCDRFEELHLTINKSVKVDTTIVACDSLEWNGSVYTVSGDYTDTLVAANGCDSIVTLHLTIENCTVPDCTVTAADTVVACDSYDWNGNTYTTSGDYVDTITLANGCDSIVTLHLTINQSVSRDEYVTVCYAAGETINGKPYGDTPGEYTDVLDTITANGCDSVITYHITVLDEIPETYITEEICEGGSFELGGVIFTQAVVDEPVILQSVDGCDSIVNVTIIVKDCKCENAVDSVFHVVICEGKEYPWRGQTYTGETHVTVPGTDANGCSINYTLNLTVAGETHYVTACDSYTYEVDGQTFTQTATGTYTHPLANGCEYVLNLTINKSEEDHQVVSSCGAYEWPINGQVYDKSGEYQYKDTTSEGCTLTYYLHLTVTNVEDTETNAVICEGDKFEWRGNEYSVEGTYTDTATINGCEATHTLNLTVAGETHYVTACDSYTYKVDGQTFTRTESGVYKDTLANGCEYVLNLTINKSEKETYTVTACDSYEWHGTVYKASGEYIYDTTTVAGCERVETLKLTINKSVVINDKVTTCKPYVWEVNGQTYNATGDYNYTGKTVDGCDLTATLDLTIYCPGDSCENAVDSVFNVVICKGEEYPWRGHTYTGETHVTVPGTDANGCDIDYTLNLTVAGETHYVTACDSYTYTVDGETFTQTATGTYTHQLANGCEYVLNLTINHSEVLPTEVVSSCGAYVWPVNGQVYSQTDVYQHHDTTSEGCTLTYTLDLTVTYVEDTVITAVICDGDKFEWRGNEYSVEGTYTDTATINGCEATHTLHLVVAQGQTLTKTACDSYTIVVDGKSYTYTASIKETFELANGCDFVLDLTINKSEKETYTVTACDSYEWHGTVYEASGEYIYNATTAAGCERVETLNLTINKSVVINDKVTTCEPYVWEVNGQTYDTTDVYNYTGKTADGCDLTATLDLTIYCPEDSCANAQDSVFNVEICEGDTYYWEKSGKTYPTVLASTTTDVPFVAGVDNGNSINGEQMQYQISKDGITLDIDGRRQGNEYRIFSGRQLIITSANSNITKVEFTCTKSGTTTYGPAGFKANQGTYTYSGKVGIWTGSANEIVFTASPQVRATQIIVTYEGDAVMNTVGTDTISGFNDAGCDINYILNWQVVDCSTPDDPCLTAEVVDWRGPIYIPETTGKWYKVDVAEALASGKDIEMTVTNGPVDNDVTMKMSTECFDPASALATTTVKAIVPADWTDQIYVWVWGDDDPGSEHIATKEGDFWTYTHNGDDVNIIFKNGQGWQGSYYQTVDMTFSEDACIQLTADVYGGKATYSVVNCSDGQITVKAQVPADWTDDIYVWVWPTGGAGTEYPATKEGDFWTYTHAGDDVNIIFKNGQGWQGWYYQTEDMTFSEDACIQLTADVYGNKATYQVVDCGNNAPSTVAGKYAEVRTSYYANEVRKTIITQDRLAELNINDYVYVYVETTGSMTITATTVEDTPCEDVYVNVYAEFCGSYPWNGVIYTEGGKYVKTFPLTTGCDSIVTLYLTEKCEPIVECDTVYTEFDAQFCDKPYNWNGQLYDVEGDHVQILKKTDGCDSIVTMHLTKVCEPIPSCEDVYTEFTTTFCGTFVWNKQEYTEAGDYTQVLSKTDGCDSIVTLHLIEECEPEIPGNPCLDAIPFDWTTGAYLAADSCAWYEMDITSLVDNKQHLTLTFTNHSDTTAWVLAVFALDCEGKMAPMLLPIPGGLSIDQTIDYQLLKRSPLKRIYVGVCTDSDIELASSVESAIAEDPAPCLNATNIEYDVKYVHNPGTSWYKVSTELLKNKSDLTGIYFANKGNKRAHVTVGMVADCQYTTGTTITLPIPTGFEFSVMAPNILGKLMRELASFEKAINELDVKEIYVEITTDETIEFELSTREVNDACETAIELDWKEWEARGLQLKANEEVWYAVDVNYLLEKFINEKEITLVVSNLDSVDVDVEMSLSPTCPVMVTLDKTFTVPAGMSAKKILNSDDMLQWLAKYEKYVPYEQIKLIVEKYEGRYTVEELKEMIKNYEKYISVAQLKQELAKHKEYISYEEIVAELKKYGEYIPYDKAKTLLEKYEFFIKYYAGGAIALLDKCEPYITMDNFKKIVDYCSQYIPYEDLKQLFTIFKDYLTNDLHCYLRVKTTGDLYVGPKPLPTPCVDVVEELTVEACESYEWKGYTFTQSGQYTESKPLADPAKAEFLDWTQPIKISDFTEPWYKLDVSDVIANKSDFSLFIENDYDSTLNVTLELYSDPTDWFMYSITKDVEPGTYPKTLTYAEFEQNIGTEYDVLYLRNVNYDCELVEILNLTINNSVETEDYVKACGDYTWNGVVYNMSGDYTQTLSTINGCDSIVTLHLTILPTDDIVTNVAICEGESYTWDVDDVTYTGTSYVEVAGQNDSGCDVTYILNLIVMNQDTIDVTVCDGPYVIEVGGVQHTFDQSGTYAISNGDCATVLNLTINQSQVVEYTEVACGSYTWHGNTYTSSGDYTFIGTTDEGCELTEVLYLTINPAEDVEEFVSICEGESYTWPRNGQTYNETTTATFVGANDYGCEVTYTLHVEVIANEYKKVTACDSYTHNGVTYTESGVYTVTNGTCKLTLDLTINETGFNYYDEVACDSYEWNGNTYTESGIYYNYGGFANGCPLVEVLRLTINKSEVLNSTVTTCEPYEWYGKVYDQTGKYTYSGTTADGCSLEATLDLTIFCPTPDPVEVFDTIAEYVCDGTEYVDPNTGKKHIISSLVPATLTWDEVVTTADTIYYYHYVITPIVAPELLDDAALALISGATPVLTQGLVPDVTGTTEAIKAYYVDNDADDIADVTAVYWDAASLTVQVACGAVTHTMNLVVETECDNVLTSTHTFEVPALGVGVEENVTICAGETYTWNGKNYNATGTYEVTLTGATGCDSIATLNLTVLPAIAETVTEVTLCAGESYTWEVTGTTYNATTTESIVLKSVNGCDSVVTLNLTVLPAIAETVTEVTICAGESYTWDVTGTTYDATTTESIVLKSVNDCDSVVTLKLTVLPVIPETTDEATICAGETYTWSANGKTYNTTTTETITLTSVNGCDSVVTLNLTVLPEIPETTENVTICYGETYTWVETGKAYTTTTTESVTLKSVNGCDSVVTLNLVVLPEIPVTEEVDTICAGETYTWSANGKTYTTTTTESVTLTAANGCDSVVTLKLTVLDPIAETVVTDTICAGETYTWSANGKTYTTTTTESVTLTAANGCDSVVTLKLTVLDPIAETVEYATVCAGETYTWSVNGKTYNATTTESVTLKSVNGCDSVVTLHLTVLPEAVTETEDLVVCESELPYVWRGEVLSAAGTYTVVEQYEEFACDSVIHVLNLQVYTLTLPASVADPIAVCGNPVDVTAANADIDAHIASNLYAPNATVTWYIMKNGTWTALTDELLKGSDESVTLKYIITTDCGSIESERFENIPVEMPTPINDVDMDNLPVESKYGHRVLLLNLNAIMATHGWTPEPEEVKWYRVVNDLDVYGEPGDDEFTGVTGHYFNYVDASVMSGQYYALIVHNTVEHPDECELYMRTEVITCSTNGIAPRLLPNVARPNENMKLVDLNPEEITEIRVYSTTGELMDTYVADQVAEFIIKAAQVSGYYMVDVETQNNKVTLRYVVK